MPLNLLLIHHSVGQRLLGHLTIIDLLLHGALHMKIVTIRNLIQKVFQQQSVQSYFIFILLIFRPNTSYRI